VLQRALQINGQPHTIIGVLPERFHFAVAGGADFWLPMDQIAQTRSQRFNHWLRVVGRLKDGVTLSSARTTMGTVMARLESAYPESNSGRGISLVSLREQVTGGLRPVLIALALAVTLVLAIACANAAGLLLSRTLGRGRELAVRMAIGASRGRIVRQLLTESLLIGVGGAVLGILVARIGIGYLVGGMDRGALEYLPFLRDLRPDALTIGFLGLLAMVVGLASGLAPALVGARADVGYPVAGGHPTANRRSGHLRDGLVAGQLALTLALLTGTALVGRSLLRLLSQDLGFKAEEVVTGRVALSGPAWQQGAAQQRFFENLLERVRAIPGVRTVGAISNLPLNDGGTNTFRVEGEAEPDQAAQPEGTRRQVAGDYFQAMGIPLLAGRLFTARDDSTAQPALVLSAALAKRWFPGGVAVGRRVRFYAFPDTTWEVIGVVGDVTVGRIDAEAPPIFYMTHLQVYDNRLTLTIRSAASGVAILPALRTVLATMGPGVALYYEAPMSAVVSDSPAIVARRYPLRVIGAFAAIALLLAITGVYGVVANGVAERRRELGIRSALGATAAQLVSLIMRRGGGLIAAGIVSGGVLALVFSRTLGSMLYGIRPGDPATLVVVIGLLALTALLATWWPARRAGRVDPAEALRSDG